MLVPNCSQMAIDHPRAQLTHPKAAEGRDHLSVKTVAVGRNVPGERS
jgi:hypothetical protein